MGLTLTLTLTRRGYRVGLTLTLTLTRRGCRVGLTLTLTITLTRRGCRVGCHAAGCLAGRHAGEDGAVRVVAVQAHLRYGEIWGALGSYGEIWGDLGRLKPRLTCAYRLAWSLSVSMWLRVRVRDGDRVRVRDRVQAHLVAVGQRKALAPLHRAPGRRGGRFREIQADTGRYREIQGDI